MFNLATEWAKVRAAPRVRAAAGVVFLRLLGRMLGLALTP